MSVLKRGVKNTFRNGIRTISVTAILAISIALSLVMLLSYQAVEGRITEVKSSIGNIITVTPAGSRGFFGGGEPLTNDTVAAIKNTAHVSKVQATLSSQLTTDSTTNLESGMDAGTLGERRFGGQDGGPVPPDGQVSTGTFTLPIFSVGVDDVANARAISGSAITIASGSAFDASSSDREALIGSGIAEKNELSVGATFTAYDEEIIVAGILDTADNRFAENVVVFPLATLQELAGLDGEVSDATVQVDSIENMDATVSALQATLGDIADVVSQQDTAASALEPLQNIRGVTLASLFGALGAGAVILFLTMLMVVRERRREIGVMKAIGAPTSSIVTQFFTEGVTFTVLGGIFGTILGVVLANPVLGALVKSSTGTTGTPTEGIARIAGGPGGGFARAFETINLRGTLDNLTAAVSWEVALYAVLAVLVIAALGSMIPSFFIARVRPAEVMRNE
ncbi:MAG: FtsX-like permease family protein [Patescibacteria group bacterium]|jgi:putative ABC transport system permease protein